MDEALRMSASAIRSCGGDAWFDDGVASRTASAAAYTSSKTSESACCVGVIGPISNELGPRCADRGPSTSRAPLPSVGMCESHVGAGSCGAPVAREKSPTSSVPPERRDESARVLFVARNKALCYFVARWTCKRFKNPLSRLALISRLHVLYEPFDRPSP